MKKTVMQESEQGIIFRYDKINNTLFNFYIVKGQKFKDNTHKYKLYVELAANTKKSWLLCTIRGHKSDAVKRLDQIVRTGQI